MGLECVGTREVRFAACWTESSFRFKEGDKVKIVSKKKCQELDRKLYNRKDHSFMSEQEVTIKTVLREKVTYEPTYIIEEAEGYFWEDSFFE